jgi:hypothetical protein
MSESIQPFIDELPILDVHEHHLPELLLNPRINLLQLFQQSYAGWTVERPYCLPSEQRTEDPMLAAAPVTTWDSLQPWLQTRSSNAFVRNLVRAITEIHGNGAREITRDNWESIDQAVQTAHQRTGWHQELLARARIQTVVTDAYNNPLLDARKALGANYRSVMRINSLALGWHPNSNDHNGNHAFKLLAQVGLHPTTFDEYLDALRLLVAGMRSRGQVALKNALAYDRDVRFDEPDLVKARSAWGNPTPDAEARKAFSDFIVDFLCSEAEKNDLPMQMHLGTGILRGSHPLHAASLIERHPNTRFLLMHLAYPWSRDLLGMAFVYRNIWIDLTWSFLLSPSHFKLALHEAIEVLPDDQRMMLGGDNWHVEETYGSMKTARRLIGEVLDEKLKAEYFGRENAERLARGILQENASRFLGI